MYSIIDIDRDNCGNVVSVSITDLANRFDVMKGNKLISIEFYADEYGPVMGFNTKVNLIIDRNLAICGIIIPHHGSECKDVNLAYFDIRGVKVYLVRVIGDVWLNVDLSDLLAEIGLRMDMGQQETDGSISSRINCNSSGQVFYKNNGNIPDCANSDNVFLFLESKASEYARNSKHVASLVHQTRFTPPQPGMTFKPSYSMYQQYGIPYMQPQQPWPPRPDYETTYVGSIGGSRSPYPADWYKTVSNQQQYPYTSSQTYGGCFTQPGFGRMGMPIVPPCANPSPIPCVPPNLSGLHGPQTTAKRKGPLAVGFDVKSISGFNKPTKEDSNDDGDK